MSKISTVLLTALSVIGGLHSNCNADVIQLTAIDSRTWYDSDFDGLFRDGVSPGGPGTMSHIAFSRYEISAMRSGIAFDLSSLAGKQIAGAQLQLFSTLSANYNFPQETGPTFPPASVELHGAGGDGQINVLDVESSNLLSVFQPYENAYTNLDVTSVVMQSLMGSDPFAEFTFRIENERLPGTFSQAWFSSENATRLGPPILQIQTIAVPEPSQGVMVVILFFLVVAFNPRDGTQRSALRRRMGHCV